MRVRSYGVSITTMEEVFLHVSRRAAAEAAEAHKRASHVENGQPEVGRSSLLTGLTACCPHHCSLQPQQCLV